MHSLSELERADYEPLRKRVALLTFYCNCPVHALPSNDTTPSPPRHKQLSWFASVLQPLDGTLDGKSTARKTNDAPTLGTV